MKNTFSEKFETLEQANQLKHMGYDCFQGYYYLKPINGSDFVLLLDEND